MLAVCIYSMFMCKTQVNECNLLIEMCTLKLLVF